MQPDVVSSDEGPVALVERLGGVAQLALDVEGDSLFRHRARLCTVQVATHDGVPVIDTLAEGTAHMLAL